MRYNYKYYILIVHHQWKSTQTLELVPFEAMLAEVLI